MFILYYFFFFFKQKTAYEITVRDWSSDVCSSDLVGQHDGVGASGCGLDLGPALESGAGRIPGAARREVAGVKQQPARSASRRRADDRARPGVLVRDEVFGAVRQRAVAQRDDR